MENEIVHYFWWGKSVGSISASRASHITRPESGELRRSSAKASSRAAEVSYLWERGLSTPGCIAKSTRRILRQRQPLPRRWDQAGQHRQKPPAPRKKWGHCPRHFDSLHLLAASSARAAHQHHG